MNAFTKVIAKIGHVIEWPFVHAAKLIKTINDALRDEPAVKNAIVGLMEQIAQISADSAVAISARGLDLPDDMQTLQDAEKLWAYVTTVFIPAIDTAYSDIKVDLSLPDPTLPTSAPAPAVQLAAQ